MDDFKHIKVLNEKRNVISYIKPIYQLANFLALSPPYNFDYIEKKTKAGNYKYYPVIFVSFIISAYCYGMYGSVKKIYPYSQTTTVVIQILFYFLIVLSNVISMLGGGFYSWKSWNLMLDTFSKVDSQVNFYKSESTSNKTFYFQIFVGHVFLFIVFGFDIYVGVENYGMDIYQYYMCVRFQLYFILIEVILMCNFAISIKKRFKYFNDILRKISWNENKLFVIKSKQKSITSLSLNSFGKLTDLKSITRMFTVLSELVELYNKIFGWQILILMGIVLLSLLESFNFIMVYGISTKETFGRKSPIDMIALSLLTTAMLLLWGVLVIVYCDAANKEVHKSATISFQLLPDVADTPTDVKKLLFLAQQAANRCPQLSAADVFDVNISTLFALFGSITTYVVVVIQFNTM